jgi:hypothetical protein
MAAPDWNHSVELTFRTPQDIVDIHSETEAFGNVRSTYLGPVDEGTYHKNVAQCKHMAQDFAFARGAWMMDHAILVQAMYMERHNDPTCCRSWLYGARRRLNPRIDPEAPFTVHHVFKPKSPKAIIWVKDADNPVIASLPGEIIHSTSTGHHVTCLDNLLAMAWERKSAIVQGQTVTGTQTGYKCSTRVITNRDPYKPLPAPPRRWQRKPEGLNFLSMALLMSGNASAMNQT